MKIKMELITNNKLINLRGGTKGGDIKDLKKNINMTNNNKPNPKLIKAMTISGKLSGIGNTESFLKVTIQEKLSNNNTASTDGSLKCQVPDFSYRDSTRFCLN